MKRFLVALGLFAGALGILALLLGLSLYKTISEERATGFGIVISGPSLVALALLVVVLAIGSAWLAGRLLGPHSQR